MEKEERKEGREKGGEKRREKIIDEGEGRREQEGGREDIQQIKSKLPL
jgi:hypothetical protein